MVAIINRFIRKSVSDVQVRFKLYMTPSVFHNYLHTPTEVKPFQFCNATIKFKYFFNSQINIYMICLYTISTNYSLKVRGMSVKFVDTARKSESRRIEHGKRISSKRASFSQPRCVKWYRHCLYFVIFRFFTVYTYAYPGQQRILRIELLRFR